MSEQRTRSEVLDEWVKAKMEGIATDALCDSGVPWKLFEESPEPQWWEFRESVIRVLFEMDHEQTRAEIHAQYIRENCL